MKRSVSKTSTKPAAKPQATPADPMAALTPKGLGLRVGLPIVGVWIVAVLIGRTWALAGAGLLTACAAGLVIWAIRFAKKTRAVANLAPRGR